jgi:hypothetical protein
MASMHIWHFLVGGAWYWWHMAENSETNMMSPAK